MTVLDVSKNLKLNWTFVKNIEKSYLAKNFSDPPLSHVEYLAVDEFAVEKGHKYMTVVIDHSPGDVLYVGEGKSEETLRPFWQKLRQSEAKIKAAAMDMWRPYMENFLQYFPKAEVVFDHFHIEQNINRVVSDVRRQQYRACKHQKDKKVLKGTRWLLLKHSSKLSQQRYEESKLQQALQINRPLAITCYLKEELKLFWQQRSIEEANQFLGHWVAKAKSSGIHILSKFADKLIKHRAGLFSWFRHKISTGPLEGLNNKIKVLKRKAYGFKDKTYFKLKIMAINHDPAIRILNIEICEDPKNFKNEL